MKARTTTPIRTCAGCGTRGPQRELVCLQQDRDGRLGVTDLRRRHAGRSAYVHPRLDCVERLARGRLLARSLRAALEPAAREDAVVGLRETLRSRMTNGTEASEQIDS